MTRQAKLWVALGAAVALYLLARSDTGSTFVTDVLTGMPRGIRLNNPGNIRQNPGTTWTGQVPTLDTRDPEFVEFTKPEYGIRAMARILKQYAGRGLITIERIVAQWAPPSENDTEAYISDVEQATGFARDAPLSLSQMFALIPAIIHHEQGIQPYSPATINLGVSLA